MFFVIDGIDASGKTTQVDLTAQKLRSLGKTCKIVDFPRYEKESSYFVRQYLEGNYGDFVDAKTSALFFTMDRYAASVELKNDIQNYDYVIANRYVSSTMIHHGCKIASQPERELFFEWLEDLEYQVCKIPRPDKILFLSLNFENNIRLLEQRAEKNKDRISDLHEKNHVYLKNAWNLGHEIALEKNWEVIPCDTSHIIFERDYITQQILKKII